MYTEVFPFLFYSDKNRKKSSVKDSTTSQSTSTSNDNVNKNDLLEMIQSVMKTSMQEQIKSSIEAAFTDYEQAWQESAEVETEHVDQSFVNQDNDVIEVEEAVETENPTADTLSIIQKALIQEVEVPEEEIKVDKNLKNLIHLVISKNNLKPKILKVQEKLGMGAQDSLTTASESDSIPLSSAWIGYLEKVRKEVTEKDHQVNPYFPSVVKLPTSFKVHRPDEQTSKFGTSTQVSNAVVHVIKKKDKPDSHVKYNVVTGLEMQGREMAKALSFLESFQFTAMGIVNEVKEELIQSTEKSELGYQITENKARYLTNTAPSLLEKVSQLLLTCCTVLDTAMHGQARSTAVMELIRRDTLLKDCSYKVKPHEKRELRHSRFGNEQLFDNTIASKVQRSSEEMSEIQKLTASLSAVNRGARGLKRSAPRGKSSESSQKRSKISVSSSKTTSRGSFRGALRGRGRGRGIRPRDSKTVLEKSH